MTEIEIVLELAMKWVGKPYTWGGDDPMESFDCSGFMIELYKSVGKLPRGGDWTADGLMNFGWPTLLDVYRPGVLAFWGITGRATHVEMIFAVNDGVILTVGATGGGRKVKTLDDAIKANAYIKIRPLRGGVIGLRDPFSPMSSR